MRRGNLSCWWGIQTPISIWEIPVILLYPSDSCHNPGWHENSWGKSTLGSTLPFSGDYTSLLGVTVSSPNAFPGVPLLQILGQVYPESWILYQPCCALQCQALGQQHTFTLPFWRHGVQLWPSWLLEMRNSFTYMLVRRDFTPWVVIPVTFIVFRKSTCSHSSGLFTWGII